MTTKQLSFYDVNNRIEKINEFDRLKRLGALVPWERFRKIIEETTGRTKNEKSNGRPAYDNVRLFRILILQRLYGLSDEQTEFRLNDSLSFQRFAGIAPNEPVPDARTIWLFKEQLTAGGGAKKLFEEFDDYLSKKGYAAKGGTIVDATIIEVPTQTMTPSERAELKKDQVPESWKTNKNSLAHKDADARWTKKYGTSYYGYKDHIAIDKKFKLIRNCVVTSASVGDNLVLPELLPERKNSSANVYADAAYHTYEVEKYLECKGFRNQVQRQRRKPSDTIERIAQYNERRQRIRKRIEHVFGHFVVSMKAKLISVIGLERATTTIVLNNLAYNMTRYGFLAA